MERIQDAKILLVDDNAELLELLLKILAGEGYNRLFPAKNCREARELFENEQPDFMILDVNLKRTYRTVLNPVQTAGIKIGNAQVDFRSATIKKDGAESALTAKELAILKKLADNRGNIVTFDMLCEAVWGDGYYGYENTLMVHMRHLREKIEDNPSKPEYILTVRGLGYRLAKEVAE